MGKAEQWTGAAAKIGTLLTDHYIYDGEHHVPTAIAAAGALAGEAALFCRTADLPEFGKVVVPAAETMVIGDNPRTMSALRYAHTILVNSDIPEMQLPGLSSIRRRVDSVTDGSTLPPPIVTPVCMPLAWAMNAGPRHRKDVFSIAQECGLNRCETVYALAGAMAVMIRRTRRAMPVAVCARVGFEAMLSATRRAPLTEVDASRDARPIDPPRPAQKAEAEADRDWEEALGAAVTANGLRRAGGFGRRMRA